MSIEKKKPNIVDLVIIVLAIALIGSFFYRSLVVNKRVAQEKSKIVYTLRVDNIRKPVVDELRAGEVLRDSQSLASMGKIQSVKVTPRMDVIALPTGKWVDAEVPGRYTVYLKVSSEATVTSANIAIGSKKIKIGAPLSVETQRASTRGIVYEVSIPSTDKK